MLDFPGYHLNECLFENRKTVFFRGRRDSDQQRVLAKVLKEIPARSTDQENFSAEYEITRTMNLDGVLKPLEFLQVRNRIGLITEDFSGVPLNSGRFFTEHGIEGFLKLALRVTEILCEIHRYQVIHRNLRPTAILFDPGRFHVKIIDFQAESSQKDPLSEVAVDALIDRLAYMAPEQTGRVNRQVDFSTDFYAVGVIFYELLTGSLPFLTKDPMELVHSHIARQPIPPDVRNKDVPEAVSDLVLKLLNKNQEDRYQSGYGLLADLKICLVEVVQSGRVLSFILGKQDISHRFHIPEKLYGRDLDLERLSAAFQASCLGRPRILAISGASGIGKSALVGQIHKAIAQKNGYLIKGKQEDTGQVIPYQAFLQACQDLVRQLLSESPEALQWWRERLRRALGDNGQVMVNVIPDLELIIGRQKPLETLSSTASQNRFHHIMEQFIAVAARKEHPLVLFIDDLQWAQEAMLSLVGLLLTASHVNHLLIIGAYRSESKHANPVLEKFLEQMSESAAALPPLVLKPLDLLDIQQLLRDTLGNPPEKSRPLAELILRHTAGNPFDLHLFLSSLHDEGLIRFEASRGSWEWDLDKILGHEASLYNPEKLLETRIGNLNEKTHEVLKLASCLGSRFHLKMLALALDQSQKKTAIALQEAVKVGMIEPIGETYQLLQRHDFEENSASNRHDAEIFYRFTHDRVHGEIYALMSQKQKRVSHLIIGKLLLRHAPDNLPDAYLYSLVSQLNRGRQLLEDDKERLQLAELNLKAGRKAKNANAFIHGQEFLQMGLELLPEGARENHHDLWFDLQLDLADTVFYSGNLEAAERIFELLLKNAGSLTGKARVFESRILIYNNISRFKTAVAVGLEGLKLFDLVAPHDPEKLRSTFERELSWLKNYLGDRPDRLLENLPQSKGVETLQCAKLLSYLTPPSFNTDQDLFKWLALVQVKHTIRHGLHALSAYSFAVLGILFGLLRDYEQGFFWWQFALRINQRFPDPKIAYQIRFIGCNLINHWRRHLKIDHAALDGVYRDALNFGDLVYANYTALVITISRWALDYPLLQILDQNERHIQFARRTKNRAILACHQCVSHAVLNLRGLTDGPDSLDGEGFTFADFQKQLHDASYLTGVSLVQTLAIQTLYLRGYYSRALTLAEKGRKTITYSENTVAFFLFHYFHGLILTALFPKVSRTQQARFLTDLEAIENRFRVWSDNCPENFEHKAQLLRAEVLRVSGQPLRAMTHYQNAVQAAAKQGFGMNEALAHELAGRCFREQNLLPSAVLHLKAATAGYEEWGASAKVAALKLETEEIIGKMGGWQRYSAPLCVPPQRASAGYGGILDKTTLLKAANAISGEIHIDQLLKKLMRFVLENAGAQRGLLLLAQDGGLRLEAEWDVAQEEVRLLHGLPLQNAEKLGKSAIHYVLRTKSILVIDDLERDTQFLGDEYLQDCSVKALLCFPILSRSELLGLLYLENHLAKGAFSGERVEMLQLLSPQMAVSLENARFMAHMTGLNQVLQAEVGERKKAEAALKKAQEIAVRNAHNAGKAEFANSVLHNINNVLNSVGLSCDSLIQANRATRLGQLAKSVKLVRKNSDRLHHFFTRHKRGVLLPGYLERLYEILAEERALITQELGEMEKHIKLMKDIIFTQQSHAKGAMVLESLDLILLLEDALKIQDDSLKRHRIRVIRNFQTEDPVRAHKTQLTHILVNLIKNAVEAMGFEDKRELTLETVRVQDGHVHLMIADTGVGLSPQELPRLFTHGFTTKKSGHGFGLHFCAKIMKEMGGEIRVSSPGRGLGARFSLTFAKHDP